MSSNVGNLSYEVSEQDLNEVSTEYDTGQMDGLTGVEMGYSAQEEAAIENLDRTQWCDRSVTVNPSQSPLQIQMDFKSKHTCPCCSSILLRHIRLGSIHWRCSHCRQEMPIL